MDDISNLNKEITELTFKLKNEKPELYKLLKENPKTIPNKSNEGELADDLKGYRDHLKQLINK